MTNIEDHRQDAKWLVKMLDELLPNTAEPQARQEQKQLDEVLQVIVTCCVSPIHVIAL